MRWPPLLALVLPLVGGACGPPPLGVRPVPAPAPEGARLPFLASGAEEEALLSWVEPAGPGRHRLKVARWERGWSAAVTAAEGADWFVNWADVPSVRALGTERWAVHWLEREGDGPYAYGVRIALSDDRGATWSAPITPHHDDTPSEHGFVSLLPLRRGDLGAVWLDGRETASPEGSGAMTLRAITVDRGGRPGPEELVDGRVCDCCPTAAVVLDDGTWVVAYRDRTAEDVRDVSVVRRKQGTWEPPRTVGNDGWIMPGCPVNGPALAASGSAVAVAWYSEASGPAVRVALSGDGAATFGAAARIDLGAPLGRPAVSFAGPRLVVALWLEAAPGAPEARVVARALSLGGGLGPVVEVGRTAAGREGGYPRLVPVGAALLAAWTDPRGERPVLRTARLAPPHAPD